MHRVLSEKETSNVIIYGPGNKGMHNNLINCFNEATSDEQWNTLSRKFNFPKGLRQRIKLVKLHSATEYPDRRHSPKVCNCQRCWNYTFACTARSMVWGHMVKILEEPSKYSMP